MVEILDEFKCVYVLSKPSSQEVALEECNKRDSQLPLPTSPCENTALRLALDQISLDRKFSKAGFKRLTQYLSFLAGSKAFIGKSCQSLHI